jgi:hypothetical protein
LKAFYSKVAAAAASDPLDIDGNAFNSEAYLQKLYRQHDLSALMKKEDEFAKQIQVGIALARSLLLSSARQTDALACFPTF